MADWTSEYATLIEPADRGWAAADTEAGREVGRDMETRDREWITVDNKIEVRRCSMCGYVGAETDHIGQCPRCHWDELQPAPSTMPWTDERKRDWLATAQPGDRKPWVTDPSSEWPFATANTRVQLEARRG